MRSFLEAGPSCRASPRPTDPGPTDNRVHSGRDYPLPSLAREPSLPGPFFCLICGLLSATVGTGRGLSRLGGPDRLRRIRLRFVPRPGVLRGRPLLTTAERGVGTGLAGKSRYRWLRSTETKKGTS